MKLVFTPDWFLGKDILIDGFSFIVLFAFFLLALRSYRISRKKNTLYLGIGFLLIAIAQLASILTKTVLYSDTTFVQNIGHFVITSNIVKSVDIFYYIGFFFYRFLTLIGFWIIYRLPKKNSISDVLLAFYFIILSALLSTNAYYLFHITVLILLIFIIGNYKEIYKKNKSQNTRILIIAFIILASANLFMILSNLPAVYVTANLMELFSYIILLILMIRILKWQKKGAGKI